jgi:hypothetical protein
VDLFLVHGDDEVTVGGGYRGRIVPFKVTKGVLVGERWEEEGERAHPVGQ